MTFAPGRGQRQQEHAIFPVDGLLMNRTTSIGFRVGRGWNGHSYQIMG
jgi:hypothetical protein